MDPVGRHEAPVNGTVVNGHGPDSTLVPFALPGPLELRQGGQVSPWPQPGRPERVRRFAAAHRGWLAAVPIVLVNAVAFYGQLAFLRGHLPAPAAVQVLVAVALESIAVYLAWQAHLAQLADDSALRLRLAAYAMALLIGAMNYSHYAAAHWRPTFAAVAFALCSAISPWLWSVHSRRESRDALKDKGLIEPHAVRLGVTRWVWHPGRSARVMSRATWTGETNPAAAIALIAADNPADTQPDNPVDKIAPEIAEPQDRTVSAPDKTADRRSDKTTAAAGGKAGRAAAIIRRHPDWTDAQVAKRAGCHPRTVKRVRDGVKP